MSVLDSSKSLRRWLSAEPLEDRTTPSAVVVNPAYVTDRVLVSMADGADVVSTAAKLGATP